MVLIALLLCGSVRRAYPQLRLFVLKKSLNYFSMPDAYRFGPFRFDMAERVVTRDGMLIPITPKALDILAFLLEHPNQTVTKQQLMKAVWPDTFVEEGNLTQNMSLLRKALAEHGKDSGLIVTVARRGYRLSADVAVTPETADGNSVPSHPARKNRRTIIGVTIVAIVAIAAVLVAGIILQRPRSSIRLAVLPFDNLTGDSGQDYLADGLTEELISQLGRLRPEKLGVIARTSVMGYKHSVKRIDQIGRELSVGYALESSVRRDAGRLRITSQLIRVRDQSHVWAQDFDYPSKDLIGIEDDVASAVAQAVQVRLSPADRGRLTQHAPVHAAAVDALLRGREIMRYQAMTKQHWQAAAHYIEQAIDLDSGYALAWTWRSMAQRSGVDRGFVPQDSGLREAHRSLERALALDPNLPEAYEQLAQCQRLVEWNFVAANASAQRALALDPGGTDAMAYAAVVALDLGHVDQAIALDERRVALDPADPDARATLGMAYYSAARLDEAAKSLEAIAPEFQSAVGSEYLPQIYLAQGHIKEAASAAEQPGDPVLQQYARALVYYRE